MRFRFQAIVLGLNLLTSLVYSFDYKREVVRGTNIGGWLVLEPWITPSLFDQFEKETDSKKIALDEWGFCAILGKEEAKRQLTNHWSTWFTEADVAKLAKSGINHIRIPVGYWAIDRKDSEPWVEGAFEYLVKGVNWAKSYGLKVMLDIHGAPGSQNGFDNSGKRDGIYFFDDDNNVNRMYNVIRHLTRHFSDPMYKGTVTAIELVNEPAGWALDFNKIKNFYSQGYNTVQNMNSELTVVVHDAFKPLTEWTYLPGQFQNMVLDTHIYQVFDYNLAALSKEQHLSLPCNHIKELQNSKNLGIPTIVGEFSLASTDCTKWLNGFKRGARYDGTMDKDKPNSPIPGATCKNKDELSSYTPEHHQFLKNFARQQIAVYEQAGSGWVFWNFKAEKSPEWDFLLAVDQGWIDLKSGPNYHTCPPQP